MKQLILYFLFFVGAAVIFIQCAKLFPSHNNLPGHRIAQPSPRDKGNKMATSLHGVSPHGHYAQLVAKTSSEAQAGN
jgi:hypothetical protein